jgi:hypothetical protein
LPASLGTLALDGHVLALHLVCRVNFLACLAVHRPKRDQLVGDHQVIVAQGRALQRQPVQLLLARGDALRIGGAGKRGGALKVPGDRLLLARVALPQTLARLLGEPLEREACARRRAGQSPLGAAQLLREQLVSRLGLAHCLAQALGGCKGFGSVARGSQPGQLYQAPLGQPARPAFGQQGRLLSQGLEQPGELAAWIFCVEDRPILVGDRRLVRSGAWRGRKPDRDALDVHGTSSGRSKTGQAGIRPVERPGFLAPENSPGPTGPALDSEPRPARA